MCSGSSSAPAAPPPPPPAPPPPAQAATPAVVSAGVTQRNLAASGVGPMATILTGPMGLTQPPQTTAKTLLGL